MKPVKSSGDEFQDPMRRSFSTWKIARPGRRIAAHLIDQGSVVLCSTWAMVFWFPERIGTALRAEIERRASDGWLTITHRLLNASYDDQLKVEKHMAVARRKLLRSSDPPAYAAMLAYGPSRGREGLAFIAFGKMTREERLEFAGETGVNVMDKAGTNDCLVVGFNTNEPPAPYHLITLVRRNVRASV